MDEKLLEEELKIESVAKAEAEENLRRAFEKAKKDKVAGQGKLAGKLISYSWDRCRKNLQSLLAEVAHPKKTTQGRWLPLMQALHLVYLNREKDLLDMLCLVGQSTIMDCLVCPSGVKSASMSYVAGRIGNAIEKEADIERFYQWESKEKESNVKWLKKSMDKGIDTRARQSYKIAYAVNRMHKEGYIGLSWTPQEKEVIGAKVLEMVLKGSDYYEMTDAVIEARRSHKKTKALSLTPWFKETWLANENRYLANAIMHLPMVIPPMPWSDPYDGGYYGEGKLHTQFIRLHDIADNRFLKSYTKKLSATDLSKVYAAINAMQKTPFRINPFILKTLKEIYASGGELGGVPRTEPYPTLPRLPETASDEEVKEHKKKAIGIYKQEEARKSKALRCLVALKVAEKFSKYEKIYFPWNIDYRGRCYPIPTALSPQGDDIQKSLLLFSNPSPLKEGDEKWLAIHGANLAGHDKVTFPERIAWIMEHTDDIVASASDPLGHTWWYAESKGDYPMEFLSFCNEWKRLNVYKTQNNGSVKGFLSNLPLAFDGTCSGLQHFSALLKDEVGGFAVNLLPSGKVQDIYSIVADKVNIQLLKDAKTGTEDDYKRDKEGELILNPEGCPIMKYGSRTLSQNWIAFNRIKFGQDGITRKVCKRSVMTLAYGSRQYGFKENILTDILHPYVLAHPEDSTFISPHQAATYMATLIWDAVSKTVVKAVEGMSWLQQVADIICKGGNVVSWTTPNGFLVQQNYMKLQQEVIKVRFSGSQVRFYNQKETDTIDSRRQRNGIAPNFIHSMDASHLQRVVVAEASKGNKNFMMIHDSFGTDAAHAGSMYKTIREEFINLYKDTNHLQNFLDSVSYLIDDKDLSAIPPLPECGTLDLDAIAKSDFCFA